MFSAYICEYFQDFMGTRRFRLRIWLIGFVFGCLSTTIAAEAQAISVLQKRVDKSFNRQQFDSCILYYYNLVHAAHSKSDYFSESHYWYHISWMYLLQENYPLASASRHLATICMEKSEIKNIPAKTIWEDMYLGLYSFKKSDFTNAAHYLKNAWKESKFVNPRVTLLVNLFLADWDINKQPEKECKPKTIAYLNYLQQHGDTAWFGFAMAKVSLGWCYYEETNYPACIAAYQSAIHVWEHGHIESPEWINCYHRLLSIFFYSNQNELRDRWFQRISQKIENKNKSSVLLIEFYLLKGMFFYAKSDFQEALDAYLNAAKFSKQTNNLRQSEVFNYVLESYYFLGNYSKVIDWVQHNPQQKLSLYYQSIVAYSLIKTGNSGKASDMVVDIEQRLSSKYMLYVKTIWNLYSYYCFIGNFTKCEQNANYELSWYLGHYGKIHTSIAKTYEGLASLYWNYSKPFNKVMENYHKQLYSLINEPYSPDIFKLPDVTHSINDQYLVNALINKAWAFNEMAKTTKNNDFKQRCWNGSVAHYKLAFDVSLKYTFSLPKEEQKMLYSDFNKKYYPAMVEVLNQLYILTGNANYAKQMFEYTEKSKSSLLLSMVRGVKAQKMKLIPDSLSGAEEKIRTRTELLARIRSEAYSQPKPDYSRIDEYNVELYHLKQEQDSLFAKYKKRFPAYYNTKFNTDVVNVDSLQRVLNPGQVVLQYLVGENVLTLFLVTRKDFRIFRDSIDRSFFTKVETYRRKLSEFSYEDMRDSSIRSFACQSNALYKILFQRAEPYLHGKSIVVIPDRVLTQLPFETLVENVPDTLKKSDYRNLSYLVKKHPISYNYSATLFVMHSGSQNINNPTLLSIAPSYKNLKIANYINKDALAMRSDSSKISTISGTLEEVKGIRKIFGGNSLMKNEATEARFKMVAPDYDVLHLAMHGIVNNEYPMFSKLIFTHASDSVNEGFLYTYEIYNLKIKATLVVLSACNSGNGKFYNGEGIISLARSFFTAGAKSVVMTLWAIADKTSQRLMNYFYTNLASHQSISEALQKAKIDYIENSDAVLAHPYFWAGYIVTGNSSTTFTLQKTRKIPIYLSIGAIVVIACAGWWWKKRYQNRKN